MRTSRTYLKSLEEKQFGKYFMRCRKMKFGQGYSVAFLGARFLGNNMAV